MKKRLVSMIFVLLVALLVAISVQASPPDYFYFEKVCVDPDSPFCELQNANPDDPFDVLEGGVVEYLGPVFANPQGKLSSKVILWAADGESTVTGHFRWVGDHGYFTLRRGTGALKGLHAHGVIMWVEGPLYYLEGTYHFETR